MALAPMPTIGPYLMTPRGWVGHDRFVDLNADKLPPIKLRNVLAEHQVQYRQLRETGELPDRPADTPPPRVGVDLRFTKLHYSDSDQITPKPKGGLIFERFEYQGEWWSNVVDNDRGHIRLFRIPDSEADWSAATYSGAFRTDVIRGRLALLHAEAGRDKTGRTGLRYRTAIRMLEDALEKGDDLGDTR